MRNREQYLFLAHEKTETLSRRLCGILSFNIQLGVAAGRPNGHAVTLSDSFAKHATRRNGPEIPINQINKSAATPAEVEPFAWRNRVYLVGRRYFGLGEARWSETYL